MGGDRRRSPEGDRKALWNYANDQFDRKINSGYSKKLTFFILAGDFASAEATKGLSDRPLETFGAAAGWVQSGRHSPLLGNRG